MVRTYLDFCVLLINPEAAELGLSALICRFISSRIARSAEPLARNGDAAGVRLGSGQSMAVFTAALPDTIPAGSENRRYNPTLAGTVYFLLRTCKVNPTAFVYNAAILLSLRHIKPRT